MCTNIKEYLIKTNILSKNSIYFFLCQNGRRDIYENFYFDEKLNRTPTFGLLHFFCFL